MKRRGFLFGSIGAALAAGMTLPEFERAALVEIAKGPIIIWRTGEGTTVIDCGNNTIEEVYDYAKTSTQRQSADAVVGLDALRSPDSIVDP